MELDFNKIFEFLSKKENKDKLAQNFKFTDYNDYENTISFDGYNNSSNGVKYIYRFDKPTNHKSIGLLPKFHITIPKQFMPEPNKLWALIWSYCYKRIKYEPKNFKVGAKLVLEHFFGIHFEKPENYEEMNEQNKGAVDEFLHINLTNRELKNQIADLKMQMIQMTKKYADDSKLFNLREKENNVLASNVHKYEEQIFKNNIVISKIRQLEKLNLVFVSEIKNFAIKIKGKDKEIKVLKKTLKIKNKHIKKLLSRKNIHFSLLPNEKNLLVKFVSNIKGEKYKILAKKIKSVK